jgi:Kef-type K+ transport system membrane component KefB
MLAVSTLILAALVAGLPIAFRMFARMVMPYAPKSEFAFLLMTAVVCALATRRLGVYYLVGAFVVGLTAQRFRERLPAITSERMVDAIEMFTSFFIPFYFFSAGLDFRRDDFGVEAILIGAVFLLTMVPFRMALVALHRRVVLGESFRVGVRVGISILPTLVFTLIIAEILRERFSITPAIFGGLVVYTLANTLIPGLALRLPAPGFEALHAPEVMSPEELRQAESSPAGMKNDGRRP